MFACDNPPRQTPSDMAVSLKRKTLFQDLLLDVTMNNKLVNISVNTPAYRNVECNKKQLASVRKWCCRDYVSKVVIHCKKYKRWCAAMIALRVACCFLLFFFVNRISNWTWIIAWIQNTMLSRRTVLHWCFDNASYYCKSISSEQPSQTFTKWLPRSRCGSDFRGKRTDGPACCNMVLTCKQNCTWHVGECWQDYFMAPTIIASPCLFVSHDLMEMS